MDLYDSLSESKAFYDRRKRIRFLRNNLSLLSSRSKSISGKSQAET